MSARSPGRLLAIDLDGTLLDASGRPHEVDVRAVHEARHAGVDVALVTGRFYRATRPTATRLGLRGPVACVNGNLVIRVEDDGLLQCRPIPAPHLAALQAALDRHQLAPFLFSKTEILHDERGRPFVPYARAWSDAVRLAPPPEHLEASAGGTVWAIAGIGSEAAVSAAKAELDSVLSPDAGTIGRTFAVKRSADLWGLVARDTTASKADALAYLAAYYGARLDETVVIGDWLNDVSMFRAAGRSFAMGQAPDEVKEAATDVVVQTRETGGAVAYVVQEVFGLGR